MEPLEIYRTIINTELVISDNLVKKGNEFSFNYGNERNISFILTIRNENKEKDIYIELKDIKINNGEPILKNDSILLSKQSINYSSKNNYYETSFALQDYDFIGQRKEITSQYLSELISNKRILLNITSDKGKKEIIIYNTNDLITCKTLLQIIVQKVKFIVDKAVNNTITTNLPGNISAKIEFLEKVFNYLNEIKGEYINEYEILDKSTDATIFLQSNIDHSTFQFSINIDAKQMQFIKEVGNEQVVHLGLKYLNIGENIILKDNNKFTGIPNKYQELRTEYGIYDEIFNQGYDESEEFYNAFCKSLFNFFAFRNRIKESKITRRENNSEIGQHNTNIKMHKNTILYGPPGTGKTYHSITHAISIIENKSFAEIEEQSSSIEGRRELKIKYDELVEKGQIVFTSFHQSLSYEDFIEGIKPQKMEEGDAFIRYDVEPGIFKNISNAAKTITSTPGNINWDNPKFYKMSLGGKERPDLHEWCIDNNVIGMSWGGTNDLQPFLNERNWNDYKNKFTEAFPELVKESSYNIQASFAFLNMKENDIVIVSKGNHIIDAIGIVEGPYYFDDQNLIDFVHFRKVKWIAKDLNTNPERFLKKRISQMSLYEFSKEDIKIDAFKELTSTDSKDKPYILIIDEINRGNVSQIFGELITLIEEDKRLGKDESLEVTLPYSKEKFGVPQNLYIIGTMNTADRSVEALDTALRRRFSFVPMMPKEELLSENVDGINLRKMLKTMNNRLRILKDNDHTIGHAWLMNINSLNELRTAFDNKILPLLQEYFYNDYEKLGLVLGDAFFQPTQQVNDSAFARFTSNSGLSDQYRTKNIFSLKPTGSLTLVDFTSIYENNHVS